ncbi:hypothetical protein [Streptomyces parvus]|uniref:hypothetical protein n=1 Tax=Streptomyces parvus TaxID=66428 RepID=UPI0037163028
MPVPIPSPEPTSATDHRPRPTDSLRRVLLLDAAGMAVVGVGYLVAAAPLGRLFGPSTATVALVGAVMTVMAIGTAVAALRDRITSGSVGVVIAAGVLWVVLSAVVLTASLLDLTDTGRVWTVMQILPVAVFASWQAVLLRSHRRNTRQGPAPVWEV